MKVTIFMRINRPQCVNGMAKFGGLSTIWGAVPPSAQRGTDTAGKSDPPLFGWNQSHDYRYSQNADSIQMSAWQGSAVPRGLLHTGH